MNNNSSQSKEQTKKCPQCKEEILRDAVICKHCKTKLNIGDRMVNVGKNITGCGCSLTALVILALIILMLLGLF